MRRRISARLKFRLVCNLNPAVDRLVMTAELAFDSRGLAHTTVATVLTRLGRRGVVAARRDGRQLFYRPTVSESQVRRSMVGDLIQNLFEGDPRALLAHLVSESEVAPGDLDQVQALLATRPGRERKNP